MHASVGQFVERVSREHPESFNDCRVLEVGSRYINGTVRTSFTDCKYTGLDLSPGPLVDLICHVADLPIPSLRFHTVISCEALEHDSRWGESLKAMVRLLMPGGLLVITCAAPPREEHGTIRTSPEDSPATTDYYQNLDESMFWEAMPVGVFAKCEIKVANGDLQFWGIKA